MLQIIDDKSTVHHIKLEQVKWDYSTVQSDAFCNFANGCASEDVCFIFDRLLMFDTPEVGIRLKHLAQTLKLYRYYKITDNLAIVLRLYFDMYNKLPKRIIASVDNAPKVSDGIGIEFESASDAAYARLSL